MTDFHSINESLTALEANIESSIQLEIGNLNRLLTQVADMNRQIMASETGGEPANDLRDQRDLLITQVSAIAEVSVHEREDGTKDIILAGRTMVSRDSVTLFESTYEKTADGYRMTIVTDGTKQAVSLSTGKLEGLLDQPRRAHPRRPRASSTRVAEKLIDEVNALHTQGRTANSSGLQFFTGDNMHTIGREPGIWPIIRIWWPPDAPRAPGDNEHRPGDRQPGQREQRRHRRRRPSTMSTARLLTDLASNRSTFEFLVKNQQNVVAVAGVQAGQRVGRQPGRGGRLDGPLPEQLQRRRQGHRHGAGAVRHAPEHGLRRLTR